MELHDDKTERNKNSVKIYFSFFKSIKTNSNKLKSLIISILSPGESLETYPYQVNLVKQLKTKANTGKNFKKKVS